MKDSWYKRLWAAIVLFSLALELRGLRSQGKNDTLSEYVWSKTKTPGMLMTVTGLMAWLVYHFSFGNGVPLSAWDYGTAGAGAVLGLIAWVVRGRRQ